MTLTRCVFAVWLATGWCFQQVSAAEADAWSGVVSYQYQESLRDEDENINAQSSVVSYQYFDFSGEVDGVFPETDIASYLFPGPNNTEGNIPLVTSQRKVSPSEIYSIPKKPSILQETGFDPGKMTIVLTHGWVASWLPFGKDDQGVNGWPKDFAAALAKEGVNILTWNWEEAATAAIPPLRKTRDQGEMLGKEILKKLGSDYRDYIHFIGHSLGTIVNAQAANYMHQAGYQPSLTHMTLFDEAEVTKWIFGQKLDTPEFRPIPTSAYWIDSYNSLIGFVQLLKRRFEAVNVVLFRSGLDPHGYPYNWYLKTIENPGLSDIGFKTSFESGFETILNPPELGSIYSQNLLLGTEFDFEITKADETSPTSEASSAIYEFVENRYIDPAVTLIGEAETLGANGLKWAEQQYEDKKRGVLEFFLNRQSGGGNRLQAASLSSTNGTYLWLPMFIPRDTLGCAFDFSFTESTAGEIISISIEGTNVYSLNASVLKGERKNSGFIDISDWRGRSVEVCFGLTGSATTSNSVLVENFSFIHLNPPPLLITKATGGWDLTWPITPFDFDLETTVDVVFGKWERSLSAPETQENFQRITIPMAEAARFFRLHQR